MTMQKTDVFCHVCPSYKLRPITTIDTLTKVLEYIGQRLG